MILSAIFPRKTSSLHIVPYRILYTRGRSTVHHNSCDDVPNSSEPPPPIHHSSAKRSLPVVAGATAAWDGTQVLVQTAGCYGYKVYLRPRKHLSRLDERCPRTPLFTACPAACGITSLLRRHEMTTSACKPGLTATLLVHLFYGGVPHTSNLTEPGIREGV